MNIGAVNKTFYSNKATSSTSSITCLFSITNFYSLNISIDNIKETLIVNNKGETNLMNILNASVLFGFNIEGYLIEEINEIEKIYVPSIIPVCNDEGRSDFFVYYGKYDNKFLLGDPTWGVNLYTLNEFLAIWRDMTILEFRITHNPING